MSTSATAGRARDGEGLRRRVRRQLRLLESTRRALPTALIIGGAKCGTTSLHEHLIEHPEVAPTRCKEMHYFDLNFDRSSLWYRSYFPVRGRYRHVLDSTPYYLYHPAAPARARGLLPSARLIVLLRDPVQRAYSHWQMSVAGGQETLGFAEAVAREDDRLAGAEAHLLSADRARSYSHQFHSYVSRSLYAPQIARWLAAYPREQLLVLRSEDMFADPAAIVAQVQSWLGLEVDVPASLAPVNTRAYAPLDAGTAASLAERFVADRVELERLTGQSFHWGVPAGAGRGGVSP